MSESVLPTGWLLTKVAEISSLVTKGTTPTTLGFSYQDSGVLFVKVESLSNHRIQRDLCAHISVEAHDALKRSQLEEGNVLISIAGTLGRVAVVQKQDVPANTNQALALIRIGKPILPQYIAHSLDSALAKKAVSDGGRGVGLQNLNLGQVSELPVLLAPLPEQHRIVEAIESYLTRLDDAVATLGRVQRNLKRYRASVLKAAIEGRLVPTEAELARQENREYEPARVLLERILKGRKSRFIEDAAEKSRTNAEAKAKAAGKAWTEADNENTVVAERAKAAKKYTEPAAPDPSELPELPEGWIWVAFPQLGELNRGKSKHRPRNDPRLLNGPYPFIQTSDVRHSDGFIAKYSATYSQFGLAQSRLWPTGTLCITIAANIAETGILKFDACFPDSVVGFLNQSEPILVRFVELFIRTAKGELDRYAPATAQKNINLQVLSNVVVPLPPVEEQRRLVAEVDRLLTIVAASQHTAQLGVLRIQRLRQSILKWAFEGKLVDQDPKDEPASALLERIKAERSENEAMKRTTGRGRERKSA